MKFDAAMSFHLSVDSHAVITVGISFLSIIYNYPGQTCLKLEIWIIFFYFNYVAKTILPLLSVLNLQLHVQN